MKNTGKKIKKWLLHGAFDMLEVRDVDAINLAKNECEELVIAVYSDEMYERLKGKKPEIPFEDRKILAENVKGVDYVIKIDSQNDLYENKEKLRELIKKEIEEKKAIIAEEKKEKNTKLGIFKELLICFIEGI